MYISLITDAEVKQYSPISSNIESTTLVKFIQVSQEEYIRNILGIALYLELLTAVNDSTTTAEQNTLISLIKPVLANYVAYKALPFFVYLIANKGVLLKNTNNGQAVDSQGLANVRNELLNMAEHFGSELKCYLEENKDTYPLYRGCKPFKKFNGIQFGGWDDYNCSCNLINCICNYR